MKLRVMGIEKDLVNFSNHLKALEILGRIQIVSSSKPYPNRRSIESRGYVEIKVFENDDSIISENIKALPNPSVTIEIYNAATKEIKFSFVCKNIEEAKLFIRYFYARLDNGEDEIRII